MPYPSFEITKDGAVVGKVVNGQLKTTDDDLIGMVNSGVVTYTGGTIKDTQWEGTKLVLPGEPGYLAAFVTQLLDGGYEVPVWLTQALA